MLSQLSAKHDDPTSELGRVKTQYVAGATVSDGLKSVAGACSKPAKRAKMTCQCKESSTTPLKALFLALLAERDDFENCSGTLTIENQCIPGLAAETKRAREKLAGYKISYLVAKSFQSGRGKKRTAPVKKRVVAIEAELAEAKAVHARPVGISAQSGADASLTRADLEFLKDRPGKGKQEVKLASANLDEAWKQKGESDKAMDEALRHLTEISSQDQLVGSKASSLKSQMGRRTRTGDDTTSSATEQN